VYNLYGEKLQVKEFWIRGVLQTDIFALNFRYCKYLLSNGAAVVDVNMDLTENRSSTKPIRK
jgi:hypothetical protein